MVPAHVTQVEPLSPHEDLEGTLQMSPRQQPELQVAGLQAEPRHAPERHCWPETHARHRPPSRPHVNASVPGRQVPRASMQPLHPAGTQRPPSQRCVVSHMTQLPASLPHASGRFPGWHSRAAERHPAEQFPMIGPASTGPASGGVEQTPAWQRSDEGHDWQTTPLRPQKLRLVPGMHSPPGSQQPVQLLRSHSGGHAAEIAVTTRSAQSLMPGAVNRTSPGRASATGGRGSLCCRPCVCAPPPSPPSSSR